MNHDELKQALFDRCPVILSNPLTGDSEYKYVSGIIHRVKNHRLKISAELADRCGHSVVICDPAKVRRKEMGG